MKEKSKSLIKKYWFFFVFIGAYLVGSFFEFSGIESSLFAMVAVILVVVQKEIKERESLEKRLDKISNDLNYKSNE